MTTDSYALGISLSELEASAALIPGFCGLGHLERYRPCAKFLVSAQICPCMRCSPEILAALDEHLYEYLPPIRRSSPHSGESQNA